MPRIVSYSRRPQSGQITCYLNRTYHVLATQRRSSSLTTPSLLSRGQPFLGRGQERSKPRVGQPPKGWVLHAKIRPSGIPFLQRGQGRATRPMKFPSWQRLNAEYAKQFGIETPNWSPKAAQES